MDVREVHAKVLILQYALGVAHFSASNIVFPPEGRLRTKKSSPSPRDTLSFKENPGWEKMEERGGSSKLVTQVLRKRFHISE